MPARKYDEIASPDLWEEKSLKRHKLGNGNEVQHRLSLDEHAPITQLGNGNLSNGHLSATEKSSAALNVIIPIGGIGSRFQKEGYRFPKPLINIAGRPMICWLVEKLRLREQDTLWVAVNQAVDEEFQVGQCLTKWFPKLDSRLLRLKYLTKGAVETLFIVSQSMSAEHMDRRTVSLDCDTIYFSDILSKVRELPVGKGASFYFEDTGPAPIFSYIRTDEHGLIHQIAEKRAISDKANSGAYVFPSAAALHEWSAKGLDSKLDISNHNQEYFTSLLIGEMIHGGEIPFLGVPISKADFSCVGTPSQLRDFLKRLKNKDPHISAKKQRFCFDLDMTLVGAPEVAGDYSTCPPIWRNIELVRQLHECGHHIIIQTARRMKTHKGNVGAVIADIGKTTFESLDRFAIPYDDIFFGKPWADVYVDDLAVHANMDTRREIGWMAEDEEDEAAEKQRRQKKKDAILAPRPFNHVQIVGERFVKSSKSSAILGEMFFYSRVPDALAKMFPNVHSIDYEAETSSFSISMERLKGITYSHLLVGRSLSRGRFNAFLEALHKVHIAPARSSKTLEIPKLVQQRFDDNVCPAEQEQETIYSNYSHKLKSRYESYREDYAALGKETSSLMKEISQRLEDYEKHQRGVFAEVIHGDPVFSNAVLDDSSGKILFFDVRAMQGSKFTLAGDICYDLAKVYQSLQGYDHALLSNPEDSEGMERSSNRIITPEPENIPNILTNGNSPANGRHAQYSNGNLLETGAQPYSGSAFYLDKADHRLLSELQDQFWEFVETKYVEKSKIQRADIITITASLLFSLLPLHRAEMRPIFLEMCKNVLSRGSAI